MRRSCERRRSTRLLKQEISFFQLTFELPYHGPAGLGPVIVVAGVLSTAIWWRHEGCKLCGHGLHGVPLFRQLFRNKPNPAKWSAGPSKKTPSAMAGAAAERRANRPANSPKVSLLARCLLRFHC